MNTLADRLVGLEAGCARVLLESEMHGNFKFVYYIDKKQSEYDREMVTAVRVLDDKTLEVLVCRYKFEVV